MKPKLATFSILAMLFLVFTAGNAAAQSPVPAAVAPQGSAFTYQGRLSSSGSPASGASSTAFFQVTSSST